MRGLALMALGMTLASCGGAEQSANLASLDARLANGTVLPQANEALPPVAVSNAGSLDTASLDSGSLDSGSLADAGGIPAPAGNATAPSPPVQHAAAANAPGKPGCAADMAPDPAWARRMPAAFALYPGARLTEATGVDSGQCALRAIGFTTSDAPGAVIGHYAARARAAGFDVERQKRGGELRVGGTRSGDGAAYVVFARPAAGGGTEAEVLFGD